MQNELESGEETRVTFSTEPRSPNTGARFPPRVVTTAQKRQKEWPHLGKGNDVAQKRSVVRPVWVNLKEQQQTILKAGTQRVEGQRFQPRLQDMQQGLKF